MSDSTATPETTPGITSGEAADTMSSSPSKDTFDDPLHSPQPSQQPAAGSSAPETRNEADPDSQANILAMAKTPPLSSETPPSRSTASSSSISPSVSTGDPVTQDPKILGLHAMFPSFDIALLQYVLESVSGDQDRAIDKLLAMSDPNYMPTEAPPLVDQTEQDEQLARRLLWEDQQAQRTLQHDFNPPSSQYLGSPVPPSGFPLPGGGRGGGSPPGAPTFAEFQEQFNKFAETSKKTLSSIVSKVKAKIQEYDQGRQGQNVSSAVQPNWSYDPDPEGRYGQSQQRSYYSPNSETAYIQKPIQLQDVTVPQPSNISSVTSPLPQSKQNSPSISPPARADVAATATASTRLEPPPPAPSPTLDYGKIGLLPKRPVSLLQTDNASANKPTYEEEEELEYVENPFEDHK